MENSARQSQPRRAWPRHLWASLLLLPGFAVFCTLDAWQDIFHIAWRDQEASHAFLVPLVVAWLVWVRRRRLAHCRYRSAWVGTAIVLVGTIIYVLGDRFMIQSFWHGGAVVILLGAIATVVGGEVMWRLLPAALAVFFVIPMPGRIRQSIALPMETATALATQKIYETFGFPIERSGNTLTLNGRDVNIIEACNGLRMVVALTMVSYAFAWGNSLRWYVRLILLALSPLSAIVCNVVRLIPTVWLYGYHPGEFAYRMHDLSGWVMLLVSFAILVGVIRVLRWALVPVNHLVLAYD
jgi:exosortase